MATGRILVVGFSALGIEERARDARPAPVAGLALAAGLAAVAAIRPFAALEDDRHIRVVLVVLDHLLEELGLELPRDHAIDHRSKCRRVWRSTARRRGAMVAPRPRTQGALRLVSLGATEDPASGRAARPGGSAVLRQTLLV